MRSPISGFSLIEATAALAVVAVTTTLALPAMTQALERQRVATTLHLLSTDMAMARGTAIMRRSQVVVCPRATPVTCANDGDWSAGWLVFLDPDGDRLPGDAAGILRSADAPAGRKDRLSLRSTRPLLRFQHDGRSAHSNLSVHLCIAGQQRAKLVVSNLGRVRHERPRRPEPCTV